MFLCITVETWMSRAFAFCQIYFYSHLRVNKSRGNNNQKKESLLKLYFIIPYFHRLFILLNGKYIFNNSFQFRIISATDNSDHNIISSSHQRIYGLLLDMALTHFYHIYYTYTSLPKRAGKGFYFDFLFAVIQLLYIPLVGSHLWVAIIVTIWILPLSDKLRISSVTESESQ